MRIVIVLPSLKKGIQWLKQVKQGIKMIDMKTLQPLKIEMRTPYIVWLILYSMIFVGLYFNNQLNQKVVEQEQVIQQYQHEIKAKPIVILVVTEDTPACGPIDAPAQFQDTFNEMGGKYGVDPDLLAAIAKQESNFNINALSSAGAQGLMQLTKNTILHIKLRYGLDIDPYDPQQAIEGAAAYLAELQRRFNGPQVLAAYNLGPTRLRSLKGDFSRIQETMMYVETISSNLGE